MPVGYLSGVVLFAAWTLVGLAPMRRPRVFARVSFFLGLVVKGSLLVYVIYMCVKVTRQRIAAGKSK